MVKVMSKPELEAGQVWRLKDLAGTQHFLIVRDMSKVREWRMVRLSFPSKMLSDDQDGYKVGHMYDNDVKDDGLRAMCAQDNVKYLFNFNDLKLPEYEDDDIPF